MPFSIWVTAASSAVILSIYAATQVLSARVFIALVPGSIEPLLETNAFVRSLESSGFIFSLSIIISALVGTGCIFFVVRLRKGITITEYLGFHFVPFRVLLWWIGLTLLFLLLSDGLTVLLGRPIVPDFAADLVVFDPAVISDTATYDNPHQYPAGIYHVLVNGQFVIRDGSHTGAKPGQVISNQKIDLPLA